jgi:DNA polymerase-3 subunit epsilon
VQGTFDELGRPLRDTVFVVVDLETTGGSAASCEITEIGAVKVRGGEVLGEFQTLVRPAAPIPPFIAVLTGITDRMVAEAPRLDTALPAFLEWSRGAVLVAHNAPFDLGFLAAGCERLGLPWPAPESLDTARLARRVLSRDEAPNCKLSSLARLFRTTTTPCHRALADARATVDVLHGLLERLGNLGVHSLEELRDFSTSVSPKQRRKRHLADGLPHAPGVYLFRDGRGRVLYVGTSKDLRSRVRTYFVSSEQRSRMAEMVGLADRVDAVVCAHPLEAEVRELRLIAEHVPAYNRRSRHPERAVYLKLTVERFPRLSVVRRVLGDGATYLGPFPGGGRAELAMAALHEAIPLRQCTGRLSSRTRRPACILAQMRRCGAPCQGPEGEEEYGAHVEAARQVMTGDPARVVDTLTARISALARGERYEDAALARDRLAALVRTAARAQRLTALTRLPLLVAARPAELAGSPPAGAPGWDLAVVRYGRLVAAASVPPGAAPRPHVDALLATAETVEAPGPGAGPTPCASAEESEVVLRWLERPGTRLVELEGSWCSPARGAGRLRAWLDAADQGREAATPFTDRRALRPAARPARAAAV